MTFILPFIRLISFVAPELIDSFFSFEFLRMKLRDLFEKNEFYTNYYRHLTI